LARFAATKAWSEFALAVVLVLAAALATGETAAGDRK
jgi:hypothetical protein